MCGRQIQIGCLWLAGMLLATLPLACPGMDLRRQSLPLLVDTWIIEEIPTRHSRDQTPDIQGYDEALAALPALPLLNLQPPGGVTVNDGGVKARSDPKRKKLAKKRRQRNQANFATKKVQKCQPVKTRLPNAGIPCDLPKDDTPMLVYFSFDDAVTSSNIGFYRRLFPAGLSNPNGCPIKATFFNSHYNTDYSLVKELFEEGHEIGSHSVTHRSPSTWWSQNATDADWYDEIVGQRTNIRDLTGGVIALDKVKGMRAPFLALGGDKQFAMLEGNQFVYDASIAYHNASPSWPFTLDRPQAMNGPVCRSVYCPTMPHHLWEVVMNVYFDDQASAQRPCSMIDGCRPRHGRQGAYDFLWTNFRRHYEEPSKVPFGINMHSAWFAYDGYLDGMGDFMDAIRDMEDVYILPIVDVLAWIQNPVPLASMQASSFGCDRQ